MESFGAQRRTFLRDSLALAAMGAVGLAAAGEADAGGAYKDPGPVPPPNVPGIKILLSGKEEEIKANWHWQNAPRPADWKFVDGVMETRLGDIVSNEMFQNFQLHVEWREPNMPNAKGQGKGNSGVFLQARYEIQVLDSYGIDYPGQGDCGAVYSQSAPLVNACRPPLQWQTYDIAFRAPRFENGQMTEKPRVTVIQNGILIQDNTIIEGPTDHKARPGEDFSTPGGIRLQYHGNSIRFRNVWVLPLPDHGSLHYEPNRRD